MTRPAFSAAHTVTSSDPGAMMFPWLCKFQSEVTPGSVPNTEVAFLGQLPVIVPETDNFKKNGFIRAHSFKASRPEVLGHVALGLQ